MTIKRYIVLILPSWDSTEFSLHPTEPTPIAIYNHRDKYKITGSTASFFAINSLGLSFEVFSAGTLWALLFLYKDIQHRKNISDTSAISMKSDLKSRHRQEISIEGGGRYCLR
jgi:hypothetical protein